MNDDVKYDAVILAITDGTTSADQPTIIRGKAHHLTILKRVPYSHKESLPKLLRETRLEAKFAQVELARRLGRQQNFVSLYERRVRRLDVLELRELCKARGVTLVSFVKRLEGNLRYACVNASRGVR